MNEAIVPELIYLASLFAVGAACFFVYDVLTAFRMLLGVRFWGEKISDVLYWLLASVLVFYVIYQKNDGVIRGYAIAGMLGGMLVYRRFMGESISRLAGRLRKKIEKRRRISLENKKKREKKELQKKQKQSTIKGSILNKQRTRMREKRLKKRNERRKEE